MLYKISFLTVISLLLLPCLSIGQCPVANFNLPATVCLGESFDIINTSVGGVKFEWDICSGDLQSNTVQASGIINGTFNKPSFITLVTDSQNWYGFVVSRFGQKIIRLDFGNDLKNTPITVDLGTFQNSFTQPIDIEFFKENGTWYALLIDVSTNKLWRMTFDSIDDTTPTLQSLDSFNALNLTDAPVDIEILTDNNNVTALITNYYGSKIIQADFSNSITNAPSGSNILIPGALHVQGIASLQTCDVWTVLTTSTDNHKVFSLRYENGLNTIPVIAEVVPTGISFSSPLGIDLVIENNIVYAFIQSTAGDVYRLKNADTVTPLGENLGQLSALSSANEGLKLVQSGTEWSGFLVNINSNKITRLDFQLKCGSSNPLSNEQAPTINFNFPGIYNVSLKAYNNEGKFSSQSKTIMVSASQAPTVAIQLDNISCVSTSNVIEVIADNPASIVSYSWNFGDGNSFVGQSKSISHPYELSGIYTVTGKVENSSGCRNQAKRDIRIFNTPLSDFSNPTGLICTNNEFTFTNNTIDNFGGNLMYQWFVDNNQTATTRDLKYVFLTNGNKDIKLKTSIPGCSSELVKTLNNVQAGPTVGFDYTGKCENELTQFTNTSSGDIASYLWDLGNGQTRTTANVNEPYTSFGNYMVSLQTTGTNGCISSTSKPITIYSKPKPDFSLDLPPFSCSGTPSQFNDLTPSPTDSNLSLWSWSFGDAANGTAPTKNPAYNYSLAGSYDVSLTTTTNFGCTATKLKMIQIAESPKSNFTVSAACLYQSTIFTDDSGTNNKSWLWKVGNSSYTVQNPIHVFTASGNFTAQLTVTGNNNCISVLSKLINVPVPAALDFSVQNNCAGQSTEFRDVTSQNADPAISRLWDFAGKGSGSGASPQFSFPTPGSYNVKLTVTNQSGCSYSLTKNTSIVKSPVADFSSSLESGPPPLTVQFTNSSSNASSYLWRFNDLNNSASLLESPSFTYPSLGDFNVDLIASNIQGCMDKKSKVTHVIIPRTEIELEEFTLLRNATTGSVRPVLTIRNNSNYTINNVDVVVDIAGTALVKEKISATILPNASSSQILNYELLPSRAPLDYLCVELRLTDDRLSDDMDLMNNSACISLQSKEILFPPYPNPVHEQLSMDWIASSEGSVKVSVISQMGQLAFQKVADVGVGLNLITLDLSKLNSGFYILIFESAEIKKTFPFVIQN